MTDTKTSAADVPPLTSAMFPANSGPYGIELHAGVPVFIIGKNGTGKSALVHFLSRIKGLNLVYLPGSRPSNFDNEYLSLTPASREQLVSNARSWDQNESTRWRIQSGTARNEKSIYDLQTAEINFQLSAAQEIKSEGSVSAAIDRLRSGTSPLDRVNALLRQSNLPVQLGIKNAQLIANRSGEIFSIARMSDGERSALIVAAEVVAAPPRTIFLIDEPELHLHKAVITPFVASLISERTDCSFIISTHELELPTLFNGSPIVVTRDVIWQNGTAHHWDVDVLLDASEVPESLLVDVLGSRRKILFIEGTSVSLDYPIYSILFPDVSVRARDTCKDVREAVAGLRADEALHRIEAYGLIDQDGGSDNRASKLEEEGLYTTTVFSVESLYYAPEVLEVIANVQATTLGLSGADMLNEASQAALKCIDEDRIAYLASRLAERRLRDDVIQRLPDRENLVSAGSAITLDVTSPYPREYEILRDLVSSKQLSAIVQNYPVRETGVLTALAKSFRFTGRKDYEKAVLTRVGIDENLRSILRNKLGRVAAKLA